ncbi:CBS domain-containing protein [Candidatus Micrarchaeota archaeon]|nr:CBS domain-containing protein [Candidatus Micrarchaeota archaeon]
MLPDLKEIGRRRRKSGMTQAQLAACAGVSQSLIAKIENASIEPAYSSVGKILDCLESAEKKEVKKAWEIASRKIFSVSTQDTLEKAVALLRKHGFSQMPVIASGRAVGSISDGKIIRLLQEGKGAATITVGEVMDEPFARISPSVPISVVAGLLKYEPAVIITEKEKAVGIITKADLLKLF